MQWSTRKLLSTTAQSLQSCWRFLSRGRTSHIAKPVWVCPIQVKPSPSWSYMWKAMLTLARTSTKPMFTILTSIQMCNNAVDHRQSTNIKICTTDISTPWLVGVTCWRPRHSLGADRVDTRVTCWHARWPCPTLPGDTCARNPSVDHHKAALFRAPAPLRSPSESA